MPSVLIGAGSSVKTVKMVLLFSIELVQFSISLSSFFVFCLARLFTSFLGPRYIHLTNSLVPLIMLSHNHQNHKQWPKWGHVPYKKEVWMKLKLGIIIKGKFMNRSKIFVSTRNMQNIV